MINHEIETADRSSLDALERLKRQFLGDESVYQMIMSGKVMCLERWDQCLKSCSRYLAEYPIAPLGLAGLIVSLYFSPVLAAAVSVQKSRVILSSVEYPRGIQNRDHVNRLVPLLVRLPVVSGRRCAKYCRRLRRRIFTFDSSDVIKLASREAKGNGFCVLLLFRLFTSSFRPRLSTSVNCFADIRCPSAPYRANVMRPVVTF